MTNTLKKLKEEMSVYYPDFTDDELEESVNNLIGFFTLGVKVISEAEGDNDISVHVTFDQN